MRLPRFAVAVMFLVASAAGAEKPDARSPGTKAAATPLDGVWRGFVVDGKGQQTDRGTVHLELTIEGNRIRAKRMDGQGGVPGEGIFRIANDRMGMIDAAETQGRGKGRVYQGIFAFTADEFRWCVATPGNKRPKTFETRGTQFLLVLKRQKS